MFDAIGTWINGVWRSFLALLDNVVYWAVNTVYELFMRISETTIFGDDILTTLASRIYALLGVFMLFKVSFSLITYILNPDDLTDKSKGVGKLLTNFFVVLVGIIAVPYVFQAAYSLQKIILKDNIIGNIIMGVDSSLATNTDYDYIKQGGRLMSYTTLSGFITLNENVVSKECADKPITSSTEGNGDAQLSEACLEYSDVFMTETDSGYTVESLLISAYKNADYTQLLNSGLINARAQTRLDEGNKEEYIFDYQAPLSALAGGFLAWILLIFCIDIATRSVKLGFLQLIAPIPIISYMDPKSGKDGIFKKWTKQCISTYLDVFMRLVAIYFAIFVISALFRSGITNVRTGAEETHILVQIFIIFGALMFAKQLPQLIADITGLKLDGKFTLNPMKKLGESPYAAGLVGAVGGAVGGLAANAWAAKQNKLNPLKGIRSAAGGFFSGGLRGGAAGLTSGGKESATAAIGKGVKGSNQARYNRSIYAGKPGIPDSKYSFMQRRIDDLNKAAGVKNKDAGVGKYDKQMKQLKQQMDNLSGQEHALRDALAKYIAGSQYSFKDFNEASLYVGGVRKADDNGNYQYVDWNTYSSSGGTLNKETFERYKSLQEGIDHYDSEYEKTRQQYKQFEDAYNSRNAAKKDK